MRKRSIAIAATMIFIFALATVAMAADPFIGTWKLNLAKSKFNPGQAPKSLTLKIAAQDNGFKWTFDTVEADGKATSAVWSGKYDGKDYLLTANPDVDAVASRKIDANRLDSVMKKGGKQIGSGRIVVSKDGKILTLTTKEKNAQGQDASVTEVYEKQ